MPPNIFQTARMNCTPSQCSKSNSSVNAINAKSSTAQISGENSQTVRKAERACPENRRATAKGDVGISPECTTVTEQKKSEGERNETRRRKRLQCISPYLTVGKIMGLDREKVDKSPNGISHQVLVAEHEEKVVYKGEVKPSILQNIQEGTRAREDLGRVNCFQKVDDLQRNKFALPQSQDGSTAVWKQMALGESCIEEVSARTKLALMYEIIALKQRQDSDNAKILKLQRVLLDLEEEPSGRVDIRGSSHEEAAIVTSVSNSVKASASDETPSTTTTLSSSEHGETMFVASNPEDPYILSSSRIAPLFRVTDNRRLLISSSNESQSSSYTSSSTTANYSIPTDCSRNPFGVAERGATECRPNSTERIIENNPTGRRAQRNTGLQPPSVKSVVHELDNENSSVSIEGPTRKRVKRSPQRLPQKAPGSSESAIPANLEKPLDARNAPDRRRNSNPKATPVPGVARVRPGARARKSSLHLSSDSEDDNETAPLFQSAAAISRSPNHAKTRGVARINKSPRNNYKTNPNMKTVLEGARFLTAARRSRQPKSS